MNAPDEKGAFVSSKQLALDMDFATAENLGEEHCRMGKKDGRGHGRDVKCGAYLLAGGIMSLVGRLEEKNAVVGRLVCNKAKRMAEIMFAFIVLLQVVAVKAEIQRAREETWLAACIFYLEVDR